MEDDASRATPRGQTTAGGASEREADRIHEQLSRVYHDLNNSLSVISGNAQLLAEMGRAEKMGPAFLEPLEDIEAARAEISKILRRLDRLRQETSPQENTSL